MALTLTLSTEDAEYLADMLAPHNIRADVTDGTVSLSDRALSFLSELGEDCDGHFDGQSVWIGGVNYPWVR